MVMADAELTKKYITDQSISLRVLCLNFTSKMTGVSEYILRKADKSNVLCCHT